MCHSPPILRRRREKFCGIFGWAPGASPQPKGERWLCAWPASVDRGGYAHERAYRLYPQVYAFENLVFAQRAAVRGKRRRVDIAAFQYHLKDQFTYTVGSFQAVAGRHWLRGD